MSHKLLPDNSHATVVFTLTQHYSSLSQQLQGLLLQIPTVEPQWVCTWGTNTVSVHFCVISQSRGARELIFNTYTCTLSTNSFIKCATCTPLCASTSSHSVMQLTHILKAHPPTHLTHIHTHAHEQNRERERGVGGELPEFTVHLNMPSHLVHTDTAVIWHSGTTGLFYLM